jgi:hypothetical protein
LAAQVSPLHKLCSTTPFVIWYPFAPGHYAINLNQASPQFPVNLDYSWKAIENRKECGYPTNYGMKPKGDGIEWEMCVFCRRSGKRLFN